MHSRFINRELSWLEFNQRVLDEASCPSVPVLERLRFVAITAANLDEFFMVRIGSLLTSLREGRDAIEPSGMSVQMQLDATSERAHEMVQDQYHCFLNELLPELAKIGIRRLHAADLTEKQLAYLKGVFQEQIFPALTPMAISDPRAFPLLLGHRINAAVRLAPKEEGGADRFALIPFGQFSFRMVTLPSEGRGLEFLLAEDVVTVFLQQFFPGESILDSTVFRITRNADLSVTDDEGTDLLAEMEDVLDDRRESFCVRLVVNDDAGNDIVQWLTTSLQMEERLVYRVPGPLALKDFQKLADTSGFDEYRYEAWPPCSSPSLAATEPIFDAISRGDILLHHPFESYEPILRLLEEAADDPDVIAIKQTLYRISRNSRIIESLRRAARNGKNVTVILELKARFDEARNIEWARQLEIDGVQVIYGVQGLKTHAKACVVVRSESHGIQRYMHFGTGNYNELTANFYTDISILTCNEELGSDVITWFNAITGYSQPLQLRQLDYAPLGLRSRLLEMIRVETQHAKEGLPARIMAKMNSLVDPDIIEALYEASEAGVDIQLNVRGICCLIPQQEGLSRNIRVVSIIDRYLEHPRLFYFLHGGNERVFISSADWMPRNLDRRIELLVPIVDDACRDRLKRILEICLADNVKGRELTPDGGYRQPQASHRDGRRSQAEFRRLAVDAEASSQAHRMPFVPHTNPQRRK